MSNHDSHYNQIIHLLIVYLLWLLSGVALVYFFIKIAPEEVTYAMFDILDIKIQIEYEEANY